MAVSVRELDKKIAGLSAFRLRPCVWFVFGIQHFPLKDRYVQNPKPQPADLIAKGYLAADGSVVDNYYIAYYGT